MGSTGVIVFLVALAALGLSVWGLFNKGRSIPCALSGVVVAIGAGLGAWHAWGESRSLAWTAVYIIFVLVGVVSIFRQVRPRN
jgi:MFS superfamily sulfate permease-like transporter